jgi:adenine-specific DNA-methyltransferase
VRERDQDLDPQIVWNGARIRLTPAQLRQLQEKGEVEIGDAQLVWRGKDRQDWSDLVVNAPPLYIQEKVQPKAIIDDLVRRSKEARAKDEEIPDLFADFNGLIDPEARTEFYQHSQHWSNRMILGDSLQVMASLAEREHLRGQVQCNYFDPPYGIKFNSNWQVSTLSRDVKDGKQADISREPEQVKAFRDTWKDGVHSYLTYLRDRLIVARDLLRVSASIFVQIGDENVHRVRAVMDEVFGPENFIAQINFKTADPLGQKGLPKAYAYICWYSKDKQSTKFRQVVRRKDFSDDTEYRYFHEVPGPQGICQLSEVVENVSVDRLFRRRGAWLAGYTESCTFSFDLFNREARTQSGKSWATTRDGIERLKKADRLFWIQSNVYFKRYASDYDVVQWDNNWDDKPEAGGEVYVVQTATKFVQRCILMTTDPGDLVVDPTCGSGTTSFVAEQWGRRWITIDTSRVALALARTRLMSARYPYYYLADSEDGHAKEQEVTGKIQPDAQTFGDLRQGFVYERAPHMTLKSIANNAEIDVIWETCQATLERLRMDLNKVLGKAWQEWEIPREAEKTWPETAKTLHATWWEARIERQKKIDASIAKSAEVEMLYDRPYEDKSRIRVAGPFTVESLSPHRVVPADEEELINLVNATEGKRRRSKLVAPPTDFADMVLEHLRTAGVHQAEKRHTITFNSLTGWPGEYIAAEGRFMEGETERRAAIFLGPEFGTLSRVDLAAAAREATDRFDVLKGASASRSSITSATKS